METIEPPSSCKVYTPLPLAEAMVGAIYLNSTQRWLEPSVGLGVFLKTLGARETPRSLVTAVDLDARTSENDRFATVYRGVDFLQWSESHKATFDCVVGNPPFVSIRSLPPRLRKTAARVIDSRGMAIGASANTWYAFVLRSIEMLRQGGNLAFVLPSCCEYANYCRPGRDSITARFDRVDLIRSRRPFFDNVQEGTAVLICRAKDGDGRVFRRHELNESEAVIRRLGELTEYSAKRCPNGRVRKDEAETLLGSVVQVGLGGVTGDAQYFAFNESRRRQLGIPLRAVRPVVTKARQVRAAQVDQKGFQRLRDADERIWLFDPPESMLDHKAVRRYLDLPADRGGCHRGRYKIKNRDPWHKTPLPRKPNAFFFWNEYIWCLALFQ